MQFPTITFILQTSSLSFSTLSRMVHDLPGSVTVNCLAYLENPHVVSDLLVDFHIFNATIHCFAVGYNNPFMMCSLSYKDYLSCGPLPIGVYQVKARVCLTLSMYECASEFQVAAFLPHVHPASPTHSHCVFTLIGKLVKVSLF